MSQVATGIKPGNIAFVGDVAEQVVSGVFHLRMPQQDRDRCPATRYVTTNLTLVVNDDASVMEGPAVLVHQNEQCQIDDRAIRVLNLKRSAKP